MNHRNSIGILLAVMAVLTVMILLAEIWDHLDNQGLTHGQITVALAIVGTVLVFLVGVAAVVGARRLVEAPLQKMQAEIATATEALERLSRTLRDQNDQTEPLLIRSKGTDSARQLFLLVEKLQRALAAPETTGDQTDSIVACINEIAAQAQQMAQDVQFQSGAPAIAQTDVDSIVDEVQASGRRGGPSPAKQDSQGLDRGNWKSQWFGWLRRR